MKKPALIIGFLITVIIMLSVVKTFVSNRISTSGLELGQIDAQINSLQTENAILSEKYYTLASLTTIASEAAGMGFVEENSDFVLTNPLPIALKQ